MNYSKTFRSLGALLGCLALATAAMAQDTYRIEVDTRKEIAQVQPNMYGIFFEDINFGADGGLYAELIKNRSFDFPHPLMGWVPFGDVKVMDRQPLFDRNPNYVRLTLGNHSLTGTGLDNEGFRGIGFKKGKDYRFSFYARTDAGGPMKIRVEFVNSANDNPVTREITVEGTEWRKYTETLTSDFTDPKSRLRIRLLTEGSVDLEHVSLFPVDTWKGRENGMRKDLAEALEELNPGVFRFPGGCIVEGTHLETRYQWKHSIGPVENRPLNINRWNYTFSNKAFHDYFQSYGLGFYEYFLLAENLSADALPVLSCGIACQYEADECVPLDELQPYIDDALDLIEFANGDVTTTWGAVRAEMGHPEPFGLKMIGIGNEQWGSVYPERLEMFTAAIRAKYPEILIVGSSGPSAEGEQFEYLWPEMKRIGVDLVDEHYYKAPDWFFANAGRYDDYDRKGPKVFAGEYASHDYASNSYGTNDDPEGKANNFLSALSEAAFMTGLERNADVVHLATYAPLFAHYDAWQWRPDLIWFDNLQVVLIPNYYVQQIYGHHPGTGVLRTTSPQSDLKGGNDLYASTVVDRDNSRIIVKVVNSSAGSKDISIDLGKTKYDLTDVDILTLQSDDLTVENTRENPFAIAPRMEQDVPRNGNTVTFTAGGYSFSTVIIYYK